MDNTIITGSIFGLKLEKLEPRNPDSPPQGQLLETVNMLRAVALIWLTSFLVACYRSMSSKRWCWYRLAFLYILGTMGTLIFALLSNGVTRVLWFGIVSHNVAGAVAFSMSIERFAHNAALAEWYIIFALFFGLQKFSQYCVHFLAVYLFLMASVLIFLPLKDMFFIAEIQGAGLDWMLPMLWYVNHNRQGDAVHNRAGQVGLISALIHLLQIQVLFYGFNSGKEVFILLATLILFPWGVSLLYYARRQEGHMVFCGPAAGKDFNAMTKEFEQSYNRAVAAHDEALILHPLPEDTPLVERLTRQQILGMWTVAYVCAFLNCYFVFWYIN